MKLLPLLLLLASCATNLTADQIQWRRGIDIENWENCEALYRDAHKGTIHYGHTHSRLSRKHGNTKALDIRHDLMDNSCEWLLRDYWIEYGSYGNEIIVDSNGENND